MERLNKILAASNVASRRKADELILAGRVKVNNEIITQLGHSVKKSDEILVDDRPISKANLVYFLLNKPSGYLSTTNDDKKRRKVTDLFNAKDVTERLYPVGRLDYESAGALIMTNDGSLTKHLTNINTLIEKEYLVRVKGIVIKEKIRQLRKGIYIGKQKHLCVPVFVAIEELDKVNQSTLIRLVLSDVKNKDIKPMFQALGHEIKTLTRIRFGDITLDGVKRGSYRHLKIHEVKTLKQTNGGYCGKV